MQPSFSTQQALVAAATVSSGITHESLCGLKKQHRSGRPFSEVFQLLHTLLQTVSALQLKNGIIGEPYIKCEDRAITIEFHTLSSFTGKVFVKGKYNDQDCVIKFNRNVRTQMTYTLELGKCGMHRLRSVAPRGMNFGVTLIVSFHPIFITSIDRAYNVHCMYKEPQERVRVDLTVSALPTQTPLEYFSANPKCDYTVRRDSPNGPFVSFANVGDTVYHVWSCTGVVDMSVLIKQCYVGDANNQVAVIDDNGCVTDDLLLDELTYDVGLTRAHSRSRVFKYADSNQLYFTCQIAMCHVGDCQIETPPNCARGNLVSVINKQARRRRSSRAAVELDVTTPDMTVLDIDNKMNEQLLYPVQPLAVQRGRADAGQLHTECFTPTTLAVAASGLLVLCLTCAIFTIYCTRIAFINRHSSLMHKVGSSGSATADKPTILSSSARLAC